MPGNYGIWCYIEHLVPATSNTISTCTLSLVEFAPWLRIKTETSRQDTEKMGQCLVLTHEFLCNEVPRNPRNITETSQVFMGHDPHTKTHSGDMWPINIKRYTYTIHRICADKEFPRFLTQQFKHYCMKVLWGREASWSSQNITRTNISELHLHHEWSME